MNTKNPVVHFEMPAEDLQRMNKFYNSAFGWKTQQFGEEMGNYVLVITADTDENGMIQKPGNINGGFYPKTANSAPHPSVVIAVENIQQAMKDVKDAGGTVLAEPMEIPGYGMYVSFNDTEGNRVSLMEPLMDKK